MTAETVTKREALSPAELIPLLASAAEAAGALGARAKEAVKAKVSADGKIDNMALEREQHAAHGLAWIATYVVTGVLAKWKRCSARSALVNIWPSSRVVLS